MRTPFHRSALIFVSALIASCATGASVLEVEGDEMAGSPAVGFAAAGMLLDASLMKRVPARKARAMLTIASPRVLGRAIEMGVLDGIGYTGWRDGRRAALVEVQPVKITFSARLPEGGTERQSGMAFLPAPHPGLKRALTWVVFLKGTEHLRNNVPSRGGSSERSLMEVAAALGYAVWAPDYAGMGDAEGAQEYCVPESMAASALDGLAAARRHVAGNHADYTETGRLIVLGYSQGGLAAMATLSAATSGTIPVPGLRLVAGYPLGAPLDVLIGVPFLDEASSVISRPDYNILLVIGWARAYPGLVRMEDILRPEVIESVVPLFDGTRDGDELCRLIARATGKKTNTVLAEDLYRPEYLAAIRQSPGSVPYYSIQNAARLDRWTPPSDVPIIIAATPDDEVVRFRNSENAYAWMRRSNPVAQVSLVKLASGTHGRAAVEGLLYALVDMDQRERGAVATL